MRLYGNVSFLIFSFICLFFVHVSKGWFWTKWWKKRIYIYIQKLSKQTHSQRHIHHSHTHTCYNVQNTVSVIKKSCSANAKYIYMKTRRWRNLHLNSSTICLWSICDCRCSQYHRHHTIFLVFFLFLSFVFLYFFLVLLSTQSNKICI